LQRVAERRNLLWTTCSHRIRTIHSTREPLQSHWLGLQPAALSGFRGGPVHGQFFLFYRRVGAGVPELVQAARGEGKVMRWGEHAIRGERTPAGAAAALVLWRSTTPPLRRRLRRRAVAREACGRDPSLDEVETQLQPAPAVVRHTSQGVAGKERVTAGFANLSARGFVLAASSRAWAMGGSAAARRAH
jgi:hypothetical protein